MQLEDGHIRPKHIAETSDRRETSPNETGCVEVTVKYQQEINTPDCCILNLKLCSQLEKPNLSHTVRPNVRFRQCKFVAKH
jgi:hypothetical protein